MNLRRFAARFAMPVACSAGLLLGSSVWAAEVKYVVKPIAEMKVKQLPKGPLYWRVESFPTLDQAKAAASKYRWNPDTVSYEGWPSLTAEAAGKAWLFTLGQQGAATPDGTKVAEIGPVPSITAPSTSCVSTTAADRPGPKHRSTFIMAPKPSMSSPENWRRRRRMAWPTPRPANNERPYARDGNAKSPTPAGTI